MKTEPFLQIVKFKATKNGSFSKRFSFFFQSVSRTFFGFLTKFALILDLKTP